MQFKVEVQDGFSWQRAKQTTQISFEEHSHPQAGAEEAQVKIHDSHYFKKGDHDDGSIDSDLPSYNLEGTKEIYQLNPDSVKQARLSATLEGHLDIDLTNHVFLSTEKSILPPIRVRIDSCQIREFKQSGQRGKDRKLVVELMMGEKSHNHEKYKIFRGSLSGQTRKQYKKSDTIEFKNIRINYPSSPDKMSKIIIVLYSVSNGQRDSFREVLVSKDLFVIDQSKMISIDTQKVLHQYFDLFGSEFMDSIRPTKLDKALQQEQASHMEKYLLKKNKNIPHLVYLSFKFPAICELYFRMPGEPLQEYGDQMIIQKRQALSEALSEALRQIQALKVEGQPQMLCNFLNPVSKLVFRINTNLRRVRIFVRQEFTQIVSIVVSENKLDLEGYAKFNGAKELKDFYLEYYSNSRKCKTSEAFSKPAVNSNSALAQMASDANLKKTRKVEDDEYEQEEAQDIQYSQGDQNLEGHDAQKKAKKTNMMLKRLYSGAIKKTVPAIVAEPKESKYPTRNKTRTHQHPDSSNNESKRNALKQKNKQKEQIKKPPSAGPPNANNPYGAMAVMGQMGGMGGMGGMGMMGPMSMSAPQFGQMGGMMPFQVMGGQGQVPSSFPLQASQQQKKDSAGGPGQQKGAQNGQPQMGMPNNMQAMYGMMGGGMPGLGMMPNFPGMQMGMMNPGAAVPNGGKKQAGKDDKDDPATQLFKQMSMMGMPGQMGGMPMMMGGMNNPFMMGGMGGQMGMPMSMQGMPMMMQGPNGQIMMIAQPNAQMPQQSTSGQPNAPSSTSAASSNPSAQGQPQVPMGMQMMMLPNMQGVNPQSMGMGMMGFNPMMMAQQPGLSATGSNMPLGGMAMPPFSMGNGFNMGMPNNPNIPKNKPADATKKTESGKKQGTSLNELNNQPKNLSPNNPTVSPASLPSFLTGAGFPPAANPLNKEQERGQAANKGGPGALNGPAGNGFPQPMMMPGGPMMLPPELMQQMAQGGQINQMAMMNQLGQMGAMGAMGGAPGQMGGAVGPMGNLGQIGGLGPMGPMGAMGGLGSMGGAMGPIGGMPVPLSAQTLNSMPPQQRQMYEQMMQMSKGMNGGMPGMFAPKKDQDKK